MLIRFDEMKEVTIPHLNDGAGSVSAKMYMEPSNKMMISRLPVGVSIGMHAHTTSSEVNYVLSGTGMAVCDGDEEVLEPGCCQYCPKGSSHSIINTGNEDLVLFTVVPEQ
ncbi:cupin domain-containing protein [Eubacterium sp. 1001713B170207_170306_E7]|uniref:cupin domain-containing protein n=1 Tax=Eubacterium sp. 1001713B170207_170306_E7 TaxID=2787097 RepID=UPI00189A8D6F|nr:cupin domain-containing protein [Eubacterium sp. 1001713B170207_170306_E7]